MSSRQAKWNKENMDFISFGTKKGFKDELKRIAEEQGFSMAGYIKHALIAQAKSDGYSDISAKIGGGGTLTLNAFRRLAERF